VLVVVLAGCGRKVAESTTPSSTADAVSSFDKDLSDVDSMEQELDTSDVDSLDQDLAAIS